MAEEGKDINVDPQELNEINEQDVRKVYASKTFINPSESCPYILGFNCEVRNVNVFEENPSFYREVCNSPRYIKRCTYFDYRISPITENKYFYASCCCPYLVEDICELRQVNMRLKNRVFYNTTCTKKDYLKKCTHFMERTCKIRVKPNTFKFVKCPAVKVDHCTIRGICVKERCKDFFNRTCCESNFIRCCPFFVESLNRADSPYNPAP